MNETQLNIRVPQKLKDQLQTVANRENRTLANVVRIALNTWLLSVWPWEEGDEAMIDAPKTLEEAKKERYGTWAGCPNGWAYNPKHCAYATYHERRFYSIQCGFKPKAGPGKLYCGIHAKKVQP